MKHLFAVLLCALATMQGIGQKTKFIVAKDGSGDFTSVQSAIDAVKDSSNYTTTIFIRKGVYKEKLRLPASKQHVRFIGEDVNSTILTYDDYHAKKDSAGKDIGTSGSSSFFIFGDDFSAENITFENAAGPVGQAVAIRITGDKVSFFHCRFLGFQDTVYTHGDNSREYFYDCYIEGTVDFIFGAATVLFDKCTLYGKRGGYFTAASTIPGKKFGYVFMNCKLTGDAPEGSFLLGRPWRPAAKTVFIRCEMGSLVHPEGWSNWSNPENEKTAYYAEYKSTGPGAAPKQRVAWSHQLTDEEAKEYTLANILSGWNPRKK